MNQILAALVNGAMLGALVTAAVWLVLRLIPRRMLNAPTRYILWWATLAMVIVLPALYLPRQHPVERPHPVEQPRGVAVSGGPANPQAGREARAPKPLQGPQSRLPKIALAPLPEVQSLTVSPLPRTIQIPATRWPRVFLVLWLLAVACLLARLAISCALLDRARRRAFDAPAHLRVQAQEWIAYSGAARRKVRVLCSTEISTPVAVGPSHPSILIPAALLEELESRELQQIGLHEAAHLARYDDCLLILQRIVEACLVLHPVVRWITRQIDLEREIACDDLVIAATGQPRSYARCLTRVVEHSAGLRSSLAATGAADDTSHLARRIDLLLDKTRQASTRLLKTKLAALVAGVAAMGWVAGQTPGIIVFASPLARVIRQAPLRPAPVLPMVHAVEAVPPQAGGPDFEGRVIEDFTGNPMASAELRFRKAGMRELAADLDTDREGRVHATGLAAGEYTVEVAKPNYITTSLKLRVPANGLVVRLVRYGAIGGQILDSRGQPAPAYIHAPGGRSVGGTRIAVLTRPPGTDELRLLREAYVEEAGRYRVHDLTPGEYAIGLWYDGLKDGSGLQLYPDNLHPRFFAISGGEEIGNIDFQIQSNAGYRVSGHVDLPQGKQQFALAMGLPGQPALPIAQTLTNNQGDFQFEKIPPGTYDLFAGGPSRGYGAHDTVLGPEPFYGRTQVTVSGQNVEGLTIPVSAGRSLRVALHAMGLPKDSADLPAGCPPGATVTVTALEPWGLIFNNGFQASFGKEQSIPRLAPGRFRLMATGLPAGCYQAGPAIADLSGEQQGLVSIELATAGSVRGMVHASGESPKAFAVVLIEANASPETPAQLAFSDTDGKFTLQGLRPGRYRIGAQLGTETARSRWVADISRMTEIEVTGGTPTDVNLDVPAKEVRQ